MLNIDDLRKELLLLLNELAEYDYEPLNSNKNSGIFEGYSGLSLLFFHLYQYTSNPKYYKRACDFFEKAFNGLNPSNLSLSHGASGIMWLLNYYSNKRVFVSDFEKYLIEYDKLLFRRINEYRINIDPMHGLLSIANYLFSRENNVALINLNKILDIVEEKKIVIAPGIAWKGVRSPNEPEEEEYFNFGYAHGLLGILYFLACFITKKIEPARARYLFDKGMIFFLSHKKINEKTFFPSMVKNISQESRKTDRISYCYGDLGIACGLMTIGRMLKDNKVLNIAKYTAENIAMVAINEISNVSDIGLCHGASGNGYMFLKLYKYYKLKILEKSSLFQYNRLLSLKEEGKGIAGYTSIDYNKELKKFYRKTDFGFINGTTGMGLSIIGFLSNGRIGFWDKILFLQ